MDKKLAKKYQESEKLQRQIEALQEKLQGVDDEAEELEKTELHKIFKTTNITFEEYTQIVKGLLNDEFTENQNKKTKNIIITKRLKGRIKIMSNRNLRGILTICIVMVLILFNNINAFASNDIIAEALYSTDIIGDEKPDESIEIYREEGIESNPNIKEPSTNGKQEMTTTVPENGYDVVLVQGGNMDAINPLATKQYIARADMTENVGEAGKEFEIFLDEGDNEESTVKQTRQFITFTTNSGKTFHLIVDHEKASQNVFLLTEVGEQDLLNMIEGEKPSINVQPIEEEKLEEEEIIEQNEEIEEKPEEKSKLSFPVILIILGAVIGVGYYFKIYKPKHEDFEDEYDEDELEYEDEYDEKLEEEEE